jgi:hypothetical protein
MTLYDSRGDYLAGAELPLATRQGQKIPNERRMELLPATLRFAREKNRRENPAARLRSLTGVYNCMGMVFASRRTWAWPEDLGMILSDDEYHRLPGPEQVEVGDVVVYRSPLGAVEHVGLVAQVNIDLQQATRRIFVLSKWGALGEYLHQLDDVPELLGTPAEYWSDRK